MSECVFARIPLTALRAYVLAGRTGGGSAEGPVRLATGQDVFISLLGDSMPEMLVFVIACMLWFNLLFVGFRLWVARDPRRGRPRSPR